MKSKVTKAMEKFGLIELLYYVFAISVVLSFATTIYANTIDDAANNLVGDIVSAAQSLSHVAVGLGVGWGGITRMFNGGNPQEVQKSDTIIKGSLLGWAFVNGFGLVTNFILPYLQ